MTDQALPEGTQQLAVTVNPQGDIIGDTSHIPDNILRQLQTPEAREQMGQQYREYHRDGGRRKVNVEIKPRMLTKPGERRDMTGLKPPGMSTREFKRFRRLQMRTWSKEALKRGREHNGSDSAQSN